MSLLSLDQIKTLYDDLRGRIEANEEGTFPDMSVGSLISDEKISNSSPYLYRPVLNGVGNRAYSKLIGATIAHNQLANVASAESQGISASISDGIITLSGIATSTYANVYNGVSIIKDHIYFLYRPIVANPNSISFTNGNLFNASLSWYGATDSRLGKANSSVTSGFGISGYSVGADFTGVKVRCELHDLTAMFGSTIADYAYTLEQGQAGAGIAWLKSYGFFGKYAPYDAGSLISTKAEKKKVVGFNLFDITTMLTNATYQDGYYVGNYSSSPRLGFDCPDIINLKQQIYVRITAKQTGAGGGTPLFRINYTDGTRTTLTIGSTTSDTVYTVSSAANKEISFFDISYGSNPNSTSVMIKDICINIFNASKNGAYEPYTSQEYDLGSDELKGLFKLDANNNIVADGDIKTPDGQITRKYGIVDLGTLTWTYGNGWYQTTIPDIKYVSANTQVGNGIAENFTVRQASGFSTAVAGELAIDTTNVKAKTGTGNAPTGYFVYELATPTTEQGTPFVDPSIVYPNGTEEYIDTRTIPVPVGNETEYTEDLKGGLETILDTPSANGTYVLKATVSGGVATLGWVAE